MKTKRTTEITINLPPGWLNNKIIAHKGEYNVGFVRECPSGGFIDFTMISPEYFPRFHET